MLSHPSKNPWRQIALICFWMTCLDSWDSYLNTELYKSQLSVTFLWIFSPCLLKRNLQAWVEGEARREALFWGISRDTAWAHRNISLCLSTALAISHSFCCASLYLDVKPLMPSRGNILQFITICHQNWGPWRCQPFKRTCGVTHWVMQSLCPMVAGLYFLRNGDNPSPLNFVF